MKIKLTYIALALLALLTLNSQLSTAFAQGTAFTYQGQLQNTNGPVHGTYNFTFSLFATNINGTAIAGPATDNGVVITNGLFTVTLDFGASYWNGQTNWLQIAVETNGAATFTNLSPRQQLTPTPYAIFAETSSNLSGTITTAQLSGTVPFAQLPAGIVTNNEAGVTLGSVTVNSNLNLNSGMVDSIGTSLLIYGSFGNFFAGGRAGNATMSGADNTGIGDYPLNLNMSGSNNTAVGYLALSQNTNGSDNTAYGFSALSANLTGSNNVAIGSGTLENSTNDNNLVAIGYQSLQNDAALNLGISGASGDNTAIGYQALMANTIGADNTAIGYQALNQNSNGYQNVAVGGYALAANTSGIANTAIGLSALQYNTNGFDNTAIGLGALRFNAGGYYNTAIGVFVLQHNTNGNNNTGIGYLALQNNSSGFENTALGSLALRFNTNGDDNTAVGQRALGNLGQGSGTTGGTNNIALGDSAGLNFSGNESSNIDIGNVGVTGESGVIRIGSSQSQTYIAGVIVGNGGGLTNLNTAQLSGTLLPAQLPSVVVTNNEPSVTLSNVTLTGTLNLPSGGTIDAGGRSLLYADGAEDLYAGLFAGNVAIAATDNTGIGYGSLQNNSNGVNNTAIGYLSLNNNTNGSFNVASGGRALFANTSGNDNAAYGRRALENNTSGSDNTAVGYEALSANPVGSQNVAVGSGALQNSTGDSGVVAVGYQALEDDNAANQGSYSGYGENTAIGYQALQSDTNGYQNTAIGYLALVSNTSGNDNTANGAQALQDNTSGTQNTANGYQALFTSTSGYANTANGCGALCNNTSGYNNTANGAGALFDDMGSSNNTANGADTLNAFTNGGQNVADGAFALNVYASGNNNTAVGFGALFGLGNGNDNIALGYNAGSAFGINESSNIDIGNVGRFGDRGITRIGTTGQQTFTYLAGNVALDNTLNIDQYGLNNGNVLSNALVFGASGLNPFSGEGIASKRTSGGNQFDLDFYTAYLNRMTILNNGDVGIGTTNPDALLSVNGTADKPGGGSWNTFSDGRLKDVGADFTHGLEALGAIQPVHYHYKAGNPLNLPSQPDYVGVVAQQVQGAIPEAVHRNQDGYLVVNNDPIIWTMFNAIKELDLKRESEEKAKDAEIQNLKQQNDLLAQRLNELEKTVKTLAERN